MSVCVVALLLRCNLFTQFLTDVQCVFVLLFFGSAIRHLLLSYSSYSVQIILDRLYYLCLHMGVSMSWYEAIFVYVDDIHVTCHSL